MKRPREGIARGNDQGGGGRCRSIHRAFAIRGGSSHADESGALSHRCVPGALFITALSLLAFASTASPALAAEACSNEAIRAESPLDLHLPDCRAYERVTPPFQNGWGKMTVQAASPDGERFIGSAIPGFAGAESNRFGAYYEIARTPEGWETHSVNPKSSEFPVALFDSANEELTKSVWTAHTESQPYQAQDLYIREADGTFVKVGPMVPPQAETGPAAGPTVYFTGVYAFAGASADLSHIYFNIANGLVGTQVWPGDTTASFNEGANSQSLYEYTGVGNTEPALVGLDSSGHLISDCGTSLGSLESNDVYNAISKNGQTTYFTAIGHSDQFGCKAQMNAPEFTELYARIDGSESVPISEPRASDCSLCQTATRADGEFAGASEDGSVVFFTTTQELLPGATTRNLYEYDFSAAAGSRVSLVSTGAPEPQVQGVSRVSQDGSHVYFVAKAALTGENAEGEEPQPGAENLYVSALDQSGTERSLQFVAPLSEADEQLWRTADGRPVQATPDGRYIAFESFAPLAGAPGVEAQVFEYDSVAEELVRVSRGANGYPQGTVNADASFALFSAQTYSSGGFGAGNAKPTTASTGLQLSADGKVVQFLSPAALTPTAELAGEAGRFSVYQYHSSASLTAGDVGLISDGVSEGRPIGIDPSGRDSIFTTESPLLPGQKDRQGNIYDARSEGGFPQSAAPPCSGEACLPVVTPPPSQPAPITDDFVGQPEQLTPPDNRVKQRLRKCRRQFKGARRARCEHRARHRSADRDRPATRTGSPDTDGSRR